MSFISPIYFYRTQIINPFLSSVFSFSANHDNVRYFSQSLNPYTLYCFSIVESLFWNCHAPIYGVAENVKQIFVLLKYAIKIDR